MRHLAFQPEALYAKSQVYIRRGLRAQAAGDNEEYQLWASLALELLGKAALAQVHPALIADPQHYQSLFAACGHKISPDVRTITAKTLFERLSHIEKTFDSRHQRVCDQMAYRRNSELHSGESPLSGMIAENWERDFWAAVELILKIQTGTLDSWLGSDDAKAPVKIIEQAEEALQWVIKNRITRCREDFEERYKDPKKRADVISNSTEFKWWEWTEGHIAEAEGRDKHLCPSCGATGMISGSLWSEGVSDDQDPDDPTTEWIDETYVVEEFRCPYCNLTLSGVKETKAAGLPEEFVRSEVRERDFGPEYGND